MTTVFSPVPRGIPALLRRAPANDLDYPMPTIVQRWADAWNTADAKAMAGLFAEDGIYDDHAFQVRSQGRACLETWVAMTCGNIPDAHAEVLEVFGLEVFGNGSRAAIRWIFSGTPTAFGSASLTGKSFSVPVASLFELTGDSIQQVSDYYSLADVLRQIGLPSGPWVPPAP